MALPPRDERGRFAKPIDDDVTQPFPILDDLSAWERELDGINLAPQGSDAGPLIRAGILLAVIVIALLVTVIVSS